MALSMPHLAIGDLVLTLPIIQGGMGVGVSKASLAGAVSAEGGLGVIASVGLGEAQSGNKSYEDRSADALREEIRKVKARGLAVGVNIMVALSNYADLVKVCVEEKADAIISGAGMPLRLPKYVGDSPIKLIPIVSSARAAQLLCHTWQRKFGRMPDAIVAEGPLAGGHLGYSFEDLAQGTAQKLEDLVASLLDLTRKLACRIPIIAAGGVFSGADIARFLNLGASGVQMGTRFVATDECDASEEYKQAFVDASIDDISVIQSPVGMPARVIANDFVDRSQRGEKSPFACPYKCLLSCNAERANYCIAVALLNASRGRFKNAFAMCGQNAHRVDKIVSVKELMAELVGDALPLLA